MYGLTHTKRLYVTDKTVYLTIGLYKVVVEIPKILVTVGASINNKLLTVYGLVT